MQAHTLTQTLTIQHVQHYGGWLPVGWTACVPAGVPWPGLLHEQVADGVSPCLRVYPHASPTFVIYHLIRRKTQIEVLLGLETASMEWSDGKAQKDMKYESSDGNRQGEALQGLVMSHSIV